MTKWITVLIASGMLLVGCSNDVAEKNSNTDEQTPDERVQEEENRSEEFTGTEETDQQETEGSTGEASEDSNASNQPEANISEEEAANLPEYDVIRKQIGEGSYKIETITDNEGTRILHFLNEQGEMQYKTVFVKDTNRLKIINTKEGGQVFNQVI